MNQKEKGRDPGKGATLDSTTERFNSRMNASKSQASSALASAPRSDHLGATLTCAAEVRSEPIDWLWEGWLPCGKLTILAGAPGSGKTTLAIAIAAIVSQGASWPDGSGHGKPGNVLIWSGEDDLSDTLNPRLMTHRADLSKVHFVDGVQYESGHRAFDPAADMDQLTSAVARLHGARLLIIDPIVAAVSGDSHKNAEVRNSLQPLISFAMQSHCAILGITHFSKGTAGSNPIDRVTGSLAFGALARVVWVAGKEEGNSERRVLARAKSNIGPDSGGIAYSISIKDVDDRINAARIEWGETIDGSAREILDQVEEQRNTSSLEEAKNFLKDSLSKGPVPNESIFSNAVALGLSKATVRRAKKALGIKPKKEGFGSASVWMWQLPIAVLNTAQKE